MRQPHKAVENTPSSVETIISLMENEKTGIKIAQVNIHLAKGAPAVISRTYNQLRFILIQEPWPYENQVKGPACIAAKVI